MAIEAASYGLKFHIGKLLKLLLIIIIIVGVKSPDQTMGLGPHIEFDYIRGECVGAKRASSPILMGPVLFKRWSKEKCLFGRTKYDLNMHPTNNKE